MNHDWVGRAEVEVGIVFVSNAQNCHIKISMKKITVSILL